MKVLVLDKETRITNGYSASHSGVDLGWSSQPMTVLAHGEGEVILSVKGKSNNKGSTGNESYGNFIKIKHNGYYTLYAHLDENYVNVGDHVNASQAIATMGETGNAYGVHLHFQVFDGNNNKIDPTPYLEKKDDVVVDNSTIANEVIAGKWGNGQDRKDRLIKAGYDYSQIQNLVNQMTQKNTVTTNYTVQPGESLSSIAKKCNTTWQKIYEDNKSAIGNNPNLIHSGLKLIIK